MSYQKAYGRINWENYPSDKTPLNEANLNKIDYAVNEVDNRVLELDVKKLDLAVANGMVKSMTYNQTNGVFTITYLNGSSDTIDTKLEKLAVNFSYDPTAQQLIITLDDGTTQKVDMSALITQYEFSDTDTVAFAADGGGKVSANVKNGSITEDKLRPDYLADIKVQAANAQNSVEAAASHAQVSENYSNLSKSYAIGTEGQIRENDTTDNAKYYSEQARQVAEGLKGALIPMGTVLFEGLPDTSTAGYMYNISDGFTTTDRFKEGAGHAIPAGANVYYTADGCWDILAGTPGSAALIASIRERLGKNSKTTGKWKHDDVEILKRILSYLEALDKSTFSYELLVRSAVFRLIAMIADESINPLSQLSSGIECSKVRNRIGDVFKYIEEHYKEPMTLPEAAAASGYVPTYFSRVFKNCTGMTFYDYLTVFRVRKAEILLVNTNDSIANIAASSGFSSVKTFDRVFKEQLGISPLKFRKMHGSSKSGRRKK